MALPKFEVSTYDIKLPISQLDIKYRPYLVKEEKNLMIANETGEQKDVINAVKNLIENCTNNTIKSGVIPMADLEYLFVNIRAKSSGETTKVSIKCPDEENTYGGEVVVNPSGGLLSKGHPLGATGLGQCAELVWQLRGEAGKRQVDNARIGLQHNLGLGGACVVTLFKKY